MAANAAAVPAASGTRRSLAPSLSIGISTIYLSIIVLLPLSALKLTLGVSLLVAIINAVAGTAIAWTLVRDRFVGQGLVNAIVDLPFALPTIVAGLTLLALYGPNSPAG